MNNKPEIKFTTVSAGEVYFHHPAGMVIVSEDFDDRYCKGSKAIRRNDGSYIAEHEPVWIAKSSLRSKA